MDQLIGVDARKLGETGVGRYVDGLLGGLTAIPTAPPLALFSYAQRWGLLGSLPPATSRYTVRSGVYAPWQHLEFWRLVRKLPLRLLHAPHFTAPLLLPRHIPLIVTIHDVAFLQRPDLVPVEYAQPWSRGLYRLALVLASHRADVICADTAAAAAEVASRLPATREKLRVLSPGIDSTRWTAAGHPTRPTAGSASAADQRDSILFVGTVTPRKGVEELVRAFAGTRARQHGARLVVVGQDRSAYARRVRHVAARLGVASQVVFAGPRTDRDLLRWYRQARVAVLPSFVEGFGLTLLEAMAAGVPCVASALPTIAEVVGDAALLVPPGNVSALAEALDRVWSDGDLQQELIGHGRGRVARFSLARMGRLALALYQELLDPQRLPSAGAVLM